MTVDEFKEKLKEQLAISASMNNRLKIIDVFLDSFERIDTFLSLNISDLGKIIPEDRLNKSVVGGLIDYQNFLKTLQGIQFDASDVFEKDDQTKEQVKQQLLEEKQHLFESGLIISKERANYLKSLITKLSRDSTLLITSEDIDEIVQILRTQGESPLEIMTILDELDRINARVSSSYTNSENEGINLDDLAITNIDVEQLRTLFKKYLIDLDSFPDDLKNRLLAHGELDLFDKKLDLLSKHGLNKIFFMKDSITKILLLTPIDKLESLMDIMEKNDLKEIFEKCSTILFPKVKTVTYKSGAKNGEVTITTSGVMDNFFKNIKTLEEHHISVSYAKSVCPSYFVYSNRLIERNFNVLERYHFTNLFNEDDHFPLSCLTADISDNVDIAIEQGLFTYCDQNKTRLLGNINYYRLKLGKKMAEERNVPFMPFRIYRTEAGEKIYLKGEFGKKEVDVYGVDRENTFSKYQAIGFEIPDYDMIHSYFLGKDCVQISNSTLEHPVIQALDENYKETDIIYNFNGVIISRYKVIRLFEKLLESKKLDVNMDSLRYIIGYNTMLDEREVGLINECLKKIGLEMRL